MTGRGKCGMVIIKMDHDVIILELVYCNNIDRVWNNWWAVVYTEMNIHFPYCG
jgi:hypothetical protein